MTAHRYLCIDIGGTKLCTGISEGSAVQNIQTVPVQKGIAPLLSQLQSIVQEYKEITAILIGCPGNIRHGTIAPGSAQNLGTFPGEFDDFNLLQALQSSIPVHIFNDATAQMAGGYALLRDTLPGVCSIGYIGPGTGLGGGFARIDDAGIHPVTDGHVFDIFLSRLGRERKISKFNIPEYAIAEDLLSGRAFLAQTGHLASDANKTTEQYHPLMLEWGHTLALLIRTLRHGTLTKKPSSPPWSADDIAFVKTVSHYLIGGGLGTSHPFGDWMLRSARDLLAIWQIPVTLLPIPDTRMAGLLGLPLLLSSEV